MKLLTVSKFFFTKEKYIGFSIGLDKFMNERCSINHPMGEKEYKIMSTAY